MLFIPLLPLILSLETLYDTDYYMNDENKMYDLDDELSTPTYEVSSPTEELPSSLNVKIPKNAFRSIRYGKIKTNPENLETLIQKEMQDISPDLHRKITKKLANSNVDRSRYKDLFFIKKRIIQDGQRRIVTFDIKEKIIPKNASEMLNRDLSLRVILAGILFLLAGLVFTTTMKMYQNVFRNKYFAYDGKKDQNKDGL